MGESPWSRSVQSPPSSPPPEGKPQRGCNKNLFFSDTNFGWTNFALDACQTSKHPLQDFLQRAFKSVYTELIYHNNNDNITRRTFLWPYKWERSFTTGDMNNINNNNITMRTFLWLLVTSTITKTARGELVCDLMRKVMYHWWRTSAELSFSLQLQQCFKLKHINWGFHIVISMFN